MAKKTSEARRVSTTTAPSHPIVIDCLHRDTLDRVADIIELLRLLDLQDGMSPRARAGLYWIHDMLIDTVKHISDDLSGWEPKTVRKPRLARP